MKKTRYSPWKSVEKARDSRDTPRIRAFPPNRALNRVSSRDRGLVRGLGGERGGIVVTLERTHTRAAPRRCARDSSLARRARSDARDVARERKMMGKTETFRTRVSSRIEGQGGGDPARRPARRPGIILSLFISRRSLDLALREGELVSLYVPISRIDPRSLPRVVIDEVHLPVEVLSDVPPFRKRYLPISSPWHISLRSKSIQNLSLYRRAVGGRISVRAGARFSGRIHGTLARRPRRERTGENETGRRRGAETKEGKG